MNIVQRVFIYSAVIVGFASCAAPRVINVSGKVTPKGNVVGGASYTANLPNRTAGLISGIVTENVRDVANRDSITFDANVERINKAALAYAIDPLGSGYDFYLRVGVATRFDMGYKLAGKANAFSAQYQFLGPIGSVGSPQPKKWYGSVALQYSWQNYKLPSLFSELQSRLGYAYKRKDILFPVIFSYSLGDEEKYGSVSFGAAYSYTHITYTTLPDKVFTQNKVPVLGKKNIQGFSAVGIFANAKLGYSYVYVVPAFSLFYQNYGDYVLLNGSTFNFSGFTFIPSISLQFRVGK